VTESDLASYLQAAREFMRQTHDPEFRAYLGRIGWTPGQDIAVAFDEEPVANLISRLNFNAADNPCMVAIRYPQGRFGFRLMSIEALPDRPRWRRRPQGEPVSPRATVGMLYSSLTRCDAYVPGEWTHQIRASRVPEPVPGGRGSCGRTLRD
jgi:hypothetical protein